MRIVFIALALVATLGAGVVAVLAAMLWDPTLTAGHLGVAMNVLTALLFVVTGTLIEWRRPGHRIGRLLIVAGPIYGALTLGWQSIDDLAPLLGPAANAFPWLLIPLSWVGISLIAGWIPLLFPSGRLPSARWRAPTLVIAGGGMAAVIAGALRPGRAEMGIEVDNPLGLRAWPAWLAPLADSVFAWFVAFVVLALVALVVRYRAGDPVERVQIRWLLAAIGLVAAAFLANMIEGAVRQDDGYYVSSIAIQLGLLMVPVAVAIAVLRYRLFEIDRIISRTVGWALVTAVLVVLFGTGVVALQALLAGVTQGDTLPVAVSTLVVLALFQPLRRRIQDLVDRSFDRERYDARRTVDSFAATVRNEVDLAVLHDALFTTVREAVRPSACGLWVRPGTRSPR